MCREQALDLSLQLAVGLALPRRNGRTLFVRMIERLQENLVHALPPLVHHRIFLEESLRKR
jgi:hypothetical protein